MPSAIPSLNVGGVQPPYDPISSAAGSLQAVNPNELTITAGGTLQFINGPTIITSPASPVIIQGNSIAAPGGYSASRLLGLNGAPGGNAIEVIDSYGGVAGLAFRRTDGTAASPTALVSSDTNAVLEAGGYNGAAWVFSSTWQCYAIENWTTTANGSSMTFSVTKSGNTANTGAFLLTGASDQVTMILNSGGVSPTTAPNGTEVLQVTGGVLTDTLNVQNSGTFISNGTTAVTVAATGVTANSVIIPSVKTAGGTLTYPPHVGTITAGTNFTMIGAALDTSTYNYVIVN